jgi:uncharacterized membrane protein YfcA
LRQRGASAPARPPGLREKETGVDYGSLILIVVALGAGAIAKGATGMGLPLIAMPVLASAFGLPHAISIMTIPLLVTNVWQVWRFRGERASPSVRFLWPMILGGAVGVATGTWVLTRLDERSLSMALGTILLAYVAFRLLRPGLVLSTGAGRRAALPVGVAAGLLQGSTGISSPFVATFIHAMSLGYAAHVFAVSAVFLMLSVVQFPALVVSGILRWEWLLEGLFALLPILGFMPVGQRLGARISRAAFDRLILAFLALIGAKLLLGL